MGFTVTKSRIGAAVVVHLGILGRRGSEPCLDQRLWRLLASLQLRLASLNWLSGIRGRAAVGRQIVLHGPCELAGILQRLVVSLYERYSIRPCRRVPSGNISPP